MDVRRNYLLKDDSNLQQMHTTTHVSICLTSRIFLAYFSLGRSCNTEPLRTIRAGSALSPIQKMVKEFRWKAASLLMLLLMTEWSLLQHRLPMLFNGPDNPKNCPLTWEIWTPSHAWFLGPRGVRPQTPSQSVKLFLQGYSVCSNRPHLASAVLWPVRVNSFEDSNE